jgi:spermidine synthase
MAKPGTVAPCREPGKVHSNVRALFTLAIFVGSFLLLLIQPMVAKMLLPAFGGSPGAWNTSLVFFQAVLLLGYAYAHFGPKLLGARVHAGIHLGLIVAALFLLPFSVPPDFNPAKSQLSPSVVLLGFLAASVGLPYFLVSAGAPLVQRWFAKTADPSAKDPYFLYAASNAGSLAALISYPLVVESTWPLALQALGWKVGFGVLGALLLLSAYSALGTMRDSAAQAIEHSPAPSAGQRWRWIALAAVPSSLLMGVTSYLTTNLASVPLLWIVPLSIYLSTFILAFSSRRKATSAGLGRWVALLLAPMSLILAMEATEPFLFLAILHLAAFTLAALFCHTEMAETRPPADHLTEFYLLMSLGGMLGGSFNALVAPVIFNGVWEYPIALVAVLLLRYRPGEQRLDKFDAIAPIAIAALSLGLGWVATNAGLPPGPARTGLAYGLPAIIAFLLIDKPVRYALSMGAFLAVATMLGLAAGGRVIYSERSFFGVHRIIDESGGEFRQLVHGTTIHGRQALAKDQQYLPLTYYHPTGPAGQFLTALNRRPEPQNVGLVGLGVGSLAAYAREGDRYTYFEIDPVVIRIANDPKLFTFLSNCKGSLRMVEGDARLSLKDEKPGAFDALLLDAFSSDAIPLHLLTKEALELYLSKVKGDGIVGFHISNRFLELAPVLATVADDLRLHGRYYNDTVIGEQEQKEGKEPSQWFFVSRSERALEQLDRNVFWAPISDLRRQRLWTDDRSNMLEAIDREAVFNFRPGGGD